jgi:hypothetical protein
METGSPTEPGADVKTLAVIVVLLAGSLAYSLIILNDILIWALVVIPAFLVHTVWQM